MTKIKNKIKPRYEKPVVLPLGELVQGMGGACHPGASASDCSQGSFAANNCNSGSTAGAPCNDGSVARNCAQGSAP